MRVVGTRRDGAILVSIGSGLGVIVRGADATPAFDLSLVTPEHWAEAPVTTYEQRVALQRQLAASRTVPYVSLAMMPPPQPAATTAETTKLEADKKGWSCSMGHKNLGDAKKCAECGEMHASTSKAMPGSLPNIGGGSTSSTGLPGNYK